MALLPKFKKHHRTGGPMMKPSPEADAWIEEKKKAEKQSGGKPKIQRKPQEKVDKEAKEAVKKRGGDVNDRLDVLGEYTMQFGVYLGQTFRWMLENYLGYAVWIVSSSKQSTDKTPYAQNKNAFLEYCNSFETIREEVTKKKEKDKKSETATSVSTTSPTVSTTQTSSVASTATTTTQAAAALASGHMTPSRYVASKTWGKFKPTIPPPRTKKNPSPPSSTITSDPITVDDQELCLAAEEVEKIDSIVSFTKSTQTEQQAEARPIHTPVPRQMFGPLEKQDNNPDHLLPDGWQRSLPKEDHTWVAQALFKVNAKGKAELDFSRANKLWFYPPQPPLICSQVPRPEKYFAHRLLLWMPRKLWAVKLFCPHPGCDKKELTSAGIYSTVRQVLDIDDYYNLAAEYLECRSCKRKVISWSPAIVKQLDHGHENQFPLLLTYKGACDIKVITLLRQRSLGNSSTSLHKKLTEEHSEKWLRQTNQYLTECKYICDAAKRGLLKPPVFEEPPALKPVPKFKWLLSVYAIDIMDRMDFIKASITSTFGSILKMDSTKKIVKKLAGHSAGTASWATNIGNERGEVLMSVLTASEGVGLDQMANGLMRRYAMAGVPPPKILYVDRDCCKGMCVKTKELFSLWDSLIIRLDIWHFIRRLAAGCHTEAHPLYGVYLGRLSQCIFEWDKDDLELLKSAKRNEMQQQGIRNPSDDDVITRIGRKEIALHCRRKTRSEGEITRLIYNLLETFTGEEGCDSLGVCLLDYDRTWEIWHSQKHHIQCILDPEGVLLYTQTGTLGKGNVTLPTYRCARGSTSLESFHLHINRFIPGTSASDWHFQAYLLDGLMRWNADRAASAVAQASSGRPDSYSGGLCEATNKLSMEVLGKELKTGLPKVGIYTGELIGVEYLHNQTGKVLERNVDDECDEDVDQEPLDEGFGDEEYDDDQTIPLVADVYVSTDNQGKNIISCSSSSSSSSDEDQETAPLDNEESVGPDNIEGYKEVQQLADCLIDLRDGGMFLTNAQADELIKLYNNLHDYDKTTKFSPRHQTSLTKGRFKVNKKRSTIVTPGVDSTKRSFLGSSCPAQWPDCNRYMAEVISRLGDIHPNNAIVNGKSKHRWSLICKSYKKIRDRVLSNAKILRATNIQLVEVNHTTVGQWFVRKEKKRELDSLKRKITSLAPVQATSSTPLPEANELPLSHPQVDFPAPFEHPFPENTTGMAKGKRLKKAPTVTSSQLTQEKTQPASKRHKPVTPKPATPAPKLAPRQMIPTPTPRMPPAPKIVTPVLPQPQPSQTVLLPRPPTGFMFSPAQFHSLPYLTASQPPASQLVPTQVTVQQPEKKSKRNCTKCGQPREPPSHKQYYGNWHCSSTSTKTYEEWRAELKEKRSKKST